MIDLIYINFSINNTLRGQSAFVHIMWCARKKTHMFNSQHNFWFGFCFCLAVFTFLTSFFVFFCLRSRFRGMRVHMLTSTSVTHTMHMLFGQTVRSEVQNVPNWMIFSLYSRWKKNNKLSMLKQIVQILRISMYMCDRNGNELAATRHPHINLFDDRIDRNDALWDFRIRRSFWKPFINKEFIIWYCLPINWGWINDIWLEIFTSKILRFLPT